MLNNTGIIGLCCAAANKEPSKPIIDHIAALLRDTGKYQMLVFQCFEDMYSGSRNDNGGASVFRLINYDMLDAMIIVPFSMHDRPLIDQISGECRAHGVPLISVEARIPGAFNVCFDYNEAFGAIVEHVLSWHSCRRVKLVAGPDDNPFSQTRVNACREIMRQHGLTLSDSDIMHGDFWENPTYEEMDRFFESGEPLPDVFICCNDTMAMAVCLKLNERGYHVPDDVIVTGFDGIQLEHYHKPRLTTASRNDSELAAAVLEIVDRVSAEKALEPYNVELSYAPAFSESCGCSCEDSAYSNKLLADYVRSFNYSLNFEGHVNSMENSIAADPTPENVHRVLKEYCFGNSVICLTEEFCRCFSADGGTMPEFDGFGNMKIFLSTYPDGKQQDGMTFPALRLVPQLETAFGETRTLFIVPLHFQDMVIGYFVTHYVLDEHHNERLYTFITSLDRCLENMRTHEHMSALNRRLEFMFTHDHLTRIYNRYGFYNSFRADSERLGSKAKDVFIVSIDLNDMKYINDNFGHSAGDDALCITAQALTNAGESCGSGVICSRFGGDEFVAAKVCEGDAQEQAEKFRSGFVEALDRLNNTSGKPYKVKVGMGVYSSTLNVAASIEELIDLADRLMYSDKAKHKRHPRNGV